MIFKAASIVCTLPSPPSWVMMEGGLSHFSEGLYRRDLIQIGILGGNWHFSWGWFFQVGLGNSLYKNYWLQISSKNNVSGCNFYNYFWSPYPDSWRPKVRHCNLYNLHPFFHPWHILSSPSQKYFLVGAKFFLYLLAGKISNFLGTFCIGEA